MLFRSNDTATTEIYTALNTLSLHDALPILVLDATGDDGATRRLQLLSTERLDLTADDGPITVSWSPSNALPLERTSVVAGTDLQRDILGE